MCVCVCMCTCVCVHVCVHMSVSEGVCACVSVVWVSCLLCDYSTWSVMSLVV